MDAMFHYRFITFKSYFPLIKEDLVHTVVLRGSLGMSLYAIFQQYFLTVKMPMAYHVCSGTHPISPPLSCHQSSTDKSLRFFIGATYFVFSVMVIYKKAKIKVAEATSVPTLGTPISDRRRRLGVILELGTFIIKMVFGVFHLAIMRVYNESDSDYLATTFTGRILVYGTHLFNVPVGYALYVTCRYCRDEGCRNYINRYIKSWFC